MTAPPGARPTETHIVAITNQKGGVGKTATTVGVAGALADMGKNVLVVDLDPQGSLTTTAFQMPHAPSGPGAANLYRALIGEFTGPFADLVVPYSEPNGRIDVIPSALEMVEAVDDVGKTKRREYRLERLLASARGVYDHVLIDPPPSLDILTDNALVAADGVLIPVQAEDSTLDALTRLLPQIAVINDEVRDKPLELHGFVVNLLRRPPGILARDVLKELEAMDGLPVLGTIPLSVVITESWRFGKTVTAYAPESEHAREFRKIAEAVSR